ncbi:MCE family protein [Amycolatopsis nigrescens]|uniref:MCE family protein n=1 Tax=Amycolatopsis nigrescens TaxID=381445 RepID=UPI000376EBC2|nr:MlaD family protein [Amycolatopsis nigrescens]
MLTRRVKAQVIAFVIIALSVVTFIGGQYAGLGSLFGGSGYLVRLQLADGGGVFTNSEVTYRGVAVGRVGELRLTSDGMEAELRIDDDARIPVNSRAVVANRSAVGEQYVDLQPRTDGGPFLTEGAVIPKESTAVPLPVQTLLGNLSAFTGSVPTDSLRTVVDELDAGLQGAGPNLQVLLDSANEFTRTAAEHLPQTSTLINDGTTVLQTQADSSAQWRSFSSNAKLFAAELARSDGDLRKLIGTAPQAATQLTGLLEDTNPGLSVLVANLLTTANVFEARVDGMEHLFVNLPKAVAATSTAVTPDTGHLSLALTFFKPEPCEQGYEGTVRRDGEDTTAAPFNTDARCTLPKGDESSVRGSQNAPHPGVPPAAIPGSGLAAGPLGLPTLPLVSTSMEEMLWLPK